MPIRADEPLRRITLNLYESDCLWLARTYGHGWTERVRQHIHNEVIRRKDHGPNFRLTLGDLSDD